MLFDGQNLQSCHYVSINSLNKLSQHKHLPTQGIYTTAESMGCASFIVLPSSLLEGVMV
jgi:hypothetical protein